MSTEFISVFSREIVKHLKQDYKESPLMSDQIFNEETTESRYRMVQNWEGYPRPTFRRIGEPFAPGSFRQSFGDMAIVNDWGMFDAFSLEDIADQYVKILTTTGPQVGGGMRKAFRTHEDLLGFEYLASLALGSASGSGLATFDGYSLCSTAHPISKGNTSQTQANRPSSELNMSILAAEFMYNNLRTQKMEDGYSFIDGGLDWVLINPINIRITHQVFGPGAEWERGSAEYNKNLYAGKARIIQSPNWTKSGATGTNNAWLAGAKKHYLTKVKRQEPKTKTWMHEMLNACVFAMSMRLFFTADNFRGICGSTGT